LEPPRIKVDGRGNIFDVTGSARSEEVIQHRVSRYRTSPVSLARVRDTRTPYAVEVYRRQPQFREPQNVGEQIPWDGDLGHLDRDIAPMADDLRADLDELLLSATNP
jgi:hypothetical protein